MSYRMPRVFPAKYRSDCKGCISPIEIGQNAVIFGEVRNEHGRRVKAVYHSTCLGNLLQAMILADRTKR